ncbi:MAG: MBL fold metallo-hydrolase [Eubacteriales bacterium]
MIEGIRTPGMGTNCYLVICEDTGKAAIIDPGAGSELIKKWVEGKNCKVEIIILTHGHFDHIGAVEELRKEFNVKVAIHKDDSQMLIDASENLSILAGQNISASPAEIILEDKQKIEVGNITMEVIHTPGHTPGGICLLFKDGLISGDTLFNGSVGRTDFQGGDMNALIKGINEKLMLLDDDIVVYPGHEGSTTIGRERKSNPYINGSIRI